MRSRGVDKFPLVRLDPGEIPTEGMLIHTSWGSKGMVFKVIAIDERKKLVQLQTPKTKRIVKYPTKWEDLRLTRNEEYRRRDNPQHDSTAHI